MCMESTAKLAICLVLNFIELTSPHCRQKMYKDSKKGGNHIEVRIRWHSFINFRVRYRRINKFRRFPSIIWNPRHRALMRCANIRRLKYIDSFMILWLSGTASDVTVMWRRGLVIEKSWAVFYDDIKFHLFIPTTPIQDYAKCNFFWKIFDTNFPIHTYIQTDRVTYTSLLSRLKIFEVRALFSNLFLNMQKSGILDNEEGFL